MPEDASPSTVAFKHSRAFQITPCSTYRCLTLSCLRSHHVFFPSHGASFLPSFASSFPPKSYLVYQRSLKCLSSLPQTCTRLLSSCVTPRRPRYCPPRLPASGIPLLVLFPKQYCSLFSASRPRELDQNTLELFDAV